MMTWILSSSVLILVIAGVRYFLRGKISPWLQYALWGLVLLRLLIPYTLPANRLGAPTLSKRLQQPVITQVSSASAAQYPATSAAQTADTPQSPAAEAEETVPSPEPQTQIIRPADTPKARATALSVWPTLKTGLFHLWLTGVAAVTLWLLAANLRFGVFLKKTRRQITVEGCRLRVFVSPAVKSPCLFGILRPSVYITPECLCDDTLRSIVLAHETTHHRHGDQIWSFLRCVCLALHWYNPLVWLACTLSRRDAELACDAGTIRRIGTESRGLYGRMLIHLTCSNSGSDHFLLTASTLFSTKKSIKERIIMIAKNPKATVLTMIAVLLISLTATGCAFTAAAESAPEMNETLQETAATVPDTTALPDAPEAEQKTTSDTAEEQAFYELFWELDRTSFEDYLKAHPETLDNGWDNIYINESALYEDGTEIYTAMGEQVLAIDAKNQILLVRVKDTDYLGVLAIAKDPAQLRCEASSGIGSYGETIGTITETNGGVLGMTGSGFIDPNGTGGAGEVAGYAMCEGKSYGNYCYDGGNKRIELTQDNKMYITDAGNEVASDVTDAVEFSPALIVDGNLVVNENWNSPNPRACIGQSERGEILMLVIEGRQPARSIGTDVETCAKILLCHEGFTAMNLDGGTSAVMWFDGEYVTKCSNQDIESRSLPNAWVYGNR